MEKIKSVSSIISQIVLRNLGGYASSYLGNDIYFLFEAINLLQSDLGEDYIKKIMEEKGRDWEKTKKILSKLSELSLQVKIFYDAIQDKRFEKKESDEVKTQLMFKRYFKKTAKEINLINSEIYDIFIILLNNTSVGKQTIPTEAFKVVEHTGMRKLDTTEKRKEGIVRE